jgi:oxygen-independent coproporphyrinogen-3 oxidase
VSQVGEKKTQQEYVAALCGEIAATSGDFPVSKVDTIFFGGGTPTSLPVEELTRILRQVCESFSLDDDAEISVEANPGTVDMHSLRFLRQAGFTRLSLGVQSFDDKVLAKIGRIHTAAEACSSFVQARRAGFENISLDLMYGLPLQNLPSWQNSLEMAVALKPEHLSTYGLKLEEGTPLSAGVAAGSAVLPEESEEEAMYDTLNHFIVSQGYLRYEISNYSLIGFECRHNKKYWTYLPYRGFGVAAHSFDGHERYANTDSVSGYIERAKTGISPETFRERVDCRTAMGEYAFTALRTVSGLVLVDFRNQFNQDFQQIFAEPMLRLKKLDLLKQTEQAVFLTPRGMKLANQVFAEFLP